MIGSFGFVQALTAGRRVYFILAGFIWACPRCRLVHSRSLGSFMRVLAVVGLIWVSRVHSGSLWVTLGSFWFIGSILMLAGHGRVHPGSVGLFGRALGFVGFIRVDFVHSDAWPCSLGFVALVLARPCGS